MSTTRSVLDRRWPAAARPHCGVCEHVFFLDDWDRSPYCAHWSHPTAIRVGDVCSAYATRRDAAPDDDGVGIDAEVDWTERTDGTDAPFYAATRGEERYGWVCGSCWTLEVVVDTMGRLQCIECGNEHRPREWDAAYL